MLKLKLTIAALAIAITGTVMAPTAAVAVDLPQRSVAETAPVRAADPDREADEEDAASESPYITINRWRGATSTLTTNVGYTDGSGVLNAANRGMVQSQTMSFGNFMWGVAADTVAIANGLDVFTSISRNIDVVAESLIKAFNKPIGGKNGGGTLLAIIVVLAVIAAIIQLARQHRGAGLVKRLLCMGLIAGYLVFVGSAMTGSQAPSKQAAESYKPPSGTPSWFVAKTNGMVDRVGGLTSAVVLKITKNPLELTSSAAKEKPNSCVHAANALEKEAVTAAGGNRGAEMRVMLDRMWQTTGLRTWITAQFGTGNQIGNDVFCYALDLSSTEVTPYDTYRMYELTLGDNGKAFPGWSAKKTKRAAMVNPNGNLETYAAVTAMAACNYDPATGKFTGRAGFLAAGGKPASADNLGFNPNKGQDSNGAKDTVKITGAGYEWGLDQQNIDPACRAAFAAPAGSDWWTGDYKGKKALAKGADAKYLPAFILPGNPESVAYKVQGPRTTNFIASYYGTEAQFATPLTQMYGVLSLFSTLPVIIFAAAAIVMKLILVISSIALWGALIAALFAESPWQDRLKKPVVQTVAMAFLATGMAILLGMLLVVSQAITTAGIAVGLAFGDGIAILISCLSPTLAVIGLHWAWKKIFPHAPSPMTLKGMSAWAKAAPIAASAVAAGVGGSLGSRLGNAARGGAERARSSLAETVAGNRGPQSGRKSGMGGGERRDSRPFDDTGIKTTTDVQAEDLVEAKKEVRKEAWTSRANTTRGVVSQLWGGGKRVGAQTAAKAKAGYANLALAATPEGRSKLWGDVRANTQAARKRAAQSFRSAGATVRKMPEGLASSIGLSQAERDRMRMQNPSAARRRFAMVSAGTAGVAGLAGKGIGKGAVAGGKGVARVAAGTHRAVIRSAGPGATTGQAYRLAGKRAAVVAASLAIPGAGPLVGTAALAAVGAGAARNTWQTGRAERKKSRKNRVIESYQAKQEARAEEAKDARAEKDLIKKLEQEERVSTMLEQRRQEAQAAKEQRSVEEAVRLQGGKSKHVQEGDWS